MISYILKSVLCSSLLIFIYYIVLEKEKMYRFNRFFLLFAIGFSYIIPLISIRIKSFDFPVSDIFNYSGDFRLNSMVLQPESAETESLLFPGIALATYSVVTLFLLCRFLVNVLNLLSKIKKSHKVPYCNALIVLSKDCLVPHSFLNYIFVYSADFESGAIETEILQHELTHVRQKHSIDILIIEFLLIFAWFNPLLFMFRKAVRLNHEYLADEHVVKTSDNPGSYQLLLFNKATMAAKPFFSSPFNYLVTKKRIIMMSKKTSVRSEVLKQIAVIPLIAGIGFLVAVNSVAQNLPGISEQQVSSTRDGVSPEILKEYQDIIDKYKRTTDDGRVAYIFKLNEEEIQRLTTIYLQMSREQQANQKFVMVPKSSMVLTKTVPTEKQIESFKDADMYGVWIDGVRVSNEYLSGYKNTDFAWVSESKLMKNATNYGKHVYQVDLMTNEGYTTYYNKKIAESGYALVPYGLSREKATPR